LRTTLLAGTVQRDDLMAQNVVAGRNGLGDLHHPAVVVIDELVIAPDAGDSRVINQTNTINLEELKCCLVNRLAGTVARGEIIDNRPVVGIRPRGPLQVDLITRRDSNMTLGVRGVKRADQVGIRVAGADIHGATAGVGGPPGGNNGWGLHVGVAVDVPAGVVDAVDDDVCDVAVGGGGCQEGGEGEVSSRHLREWPNIFERM
jgi:hypothetical protein